MRKKNRKVKWNRIIWITVCWVIVAAVQAAYELAVLIVNGVETHDSRTISVMVFTNMFGGFVAGILGGYMLEKFTIPWFSIFPFGKSLFLLFVFFSLVFLTVVLVLVPFASFLANPKIFEQESFDSLLMKGFNQADLWRQYFFWATVNGFTMIAIFVSEKYGPGVFLKFLQGKYFHPKKEERIFMFLDIRGASRIAERLSEKEYFSFLKNFIDDATDPILATKGEIYQYIGDEIVVSWPIKKGLKKNNCIECFFEIRKVFDELKPDYIKHFNAWPELKAGMHTGEVMVGEMGRVKRDISYSGDVLNTTARIEGECNKYKVDLLISDQLFEKLKRVSKYKFNNLGNILLRGKKQAIGIVSIELNN